MTSHVPKRITIVTDTVARTGLTAYHVKFLSATVFSALVGGVGTTIDGNALAGATFAAGSWLDGNFSALTLASGTVAIYQNV